MIPYFRIYESESQAQVAIDRLWEQDHGLRKGSTAIMSAETHAGPREQDGDVAEPVEAEPVEAVAEPALYAELPFPYRRIITENVQRGYAAVLVKPGYGFSARVKAVLNSCNPVDVEIPEYKAPQAAPLSEFLGIPVLTDTKPRARLIPRPSGTSFGFGLLSTNPAPLSSLLGLKVLSNRPGNSSFGLPLLSKSKSSWTTSFGLPLLSKSKSRWTTSFGLPLLSKSKSRWIRSFGLPLLSKSDRNY